MADMTTPAAAPRPVLGGIMVLAAASLWGTLGLFARTLYAVGVTPLEVASIRATVGVAGLALWMLVRRRRTPLRGRGLLFFAAYGFFGITLFQFAYFAAIERTTIAVAVALLYTAPAFVVVLSWLGGREPMDAARLLTLALVLSGTFLVTGAVRLILTGAATVSAAALAFGLLSGLTYGLYTLFGKRALDRYDPLETVLYASVFGALFLAIAAPPWRPMLAHPDQVPIFILLGLLPTAAAYVLYVTGLRHLTAGTASILASVEPVVAAVLGATLLDEAIGMDQAVGIGLIVGAGVLLTRRRNASPSSVSATSRV